MTSTTNSLDEKIANEEYLYRGVIDLNWDFKNDRPSSATFKDSKGVSVDRDGFREEKNCIDFLLGTKGFLAICKVKTEDVRSLNAKVKYIPLPENIYHSEIHDSEIRVQMRGSKPKKIRDKSIVIYLRARSGLN